MSNFKKYSIILSLFMFLFVSISGCSGWRSRQSPRLFTSKRNAPLTILAHETKFEVPKLADYRIGIDDILEIFMFRHPDLSRDVIVRPDGKISYLLIGDLQAAGLTVAELDDSITKGFEVYVANSLDEPMEQPLKEEYLINLGDKLNISVWEEPDFLVDVIVRPDGRISYPLVGDMKVYGKTIEKFDEELTEKLREYVKEPLVSIMLTKMGIGEGLSFIAGFISMYLEEKPDISVLVKQFGSRSVIVLGEVEEPGVYSLQGNVRLLDAIGYGGGFTDNAVRDNVFVIRGDISSDPVVIRVNAWDIIRRGNYLLNIPLQDQDVVYAPRSIVGNYNVLLEQVSPTLGLIKESTNIFLNLQSLGIMPVGPTADAD